MIVMFEMTEVSLVLVGNVAALHVSYHSFICKALASFRDPAGLGKEQECLDTTLQIRSTYATIGSVRSH